MSRRVSGRVAVSVAAGAALTLALTSCGSSSTTGSSTASPSTTSASAAPTATPTDSAPAASASVESTPLASSASPVAGMVPDPCALLSAEELTTLTGADQGAGESKTSNPAVRNYCIFPSGLSLGLEVAENYAQMAQQIKVDQQDGYVTDSKKLPGVGTKAVLANYATGVIKVIAAQGDYVVYVSGDLTQTQAAELATAVAASL